MSDPIQDLENFNREGLSVNPLAPSEVRRLGTRMRRRRNAAGVVAAAAAVAVIATPLALFAGGESRTDELPPGTTSPTITPYTTAPPPTHVLTRIPDDFPLGVGLADPDGRLEVSADGVGVGELSLCGTAVWPGTGSVDRLTARVPGVETEPSLDRELLLFDDAGAATAAVERMQTALEDCPSEPTVDPARPDLETAHVHTTYADEPTGADHTVTWTRHWEDGGLGADVWQFVQVGNAVAGYGISYEGSKESAGRLVPSITDASRDLVEEMQVFAGREGDEPGTGLTEDALITDEETVLNGAVSWFAADTSTGDGQATFNPCITESLGGRGATSVMQRQFDLRESADSDPVAPGWMTAAVGEFADEDAAAAAYDAYSGDLQNCEARLSATGSTRVAVGDPVPADLGVAGREGHVVLITYGPVEGDTYGDDSSIMETGLAVVGKRVVMLTLHIVGQDYNYEDGTPMEQMLPKAAARLS